MLLRLRVTVPRQLVSLSRAPGVPRQWYVEARERFGVEETILRLRGPGHAR